MAESMFTEEVEEIYPGEKKDMETILEWWLGHDKNVYKIKKVDGSDYGKTSDEES